jgi:hypothetical protein
MIPAEIYSRWTHRADYTEWSMRIQPSKDMDGQ